MIFGGDRAERSPILFSEGAFAAAMPKPKDLKSVTAQGQKASKADAAFDLWLQRGLHQIYDTVADEPIPQELLRLIEEDRKK